MTTPIVLTFVGHDRPGVVNAISERVAACGGTWLESRLARLAGEFAGIVLINVPAPNIPALATAFHELESAGLRVTIERSAEVQAHERRKTVRLELVGADQPGIVRDVTRALTELGVNIEEFISNIEAAPFSGAEMFRAAARLRAPDDLDSETLQKTLERVAGELMVDVTVTPSEA